MPLLVSAVVWGIAFRTDGPINALLGALGIGPQPFLTSPDQALLSIVILASWVGVGYWMTFLIAGLQDIPPDYGEAAAIDGAGWWTIFWSIYMRLSAPALVAAGLILFVFQWPANLWPLLVISDQDLDVAPVALAKYLGQFDFDFGQTFAGAVIIAAIPVAILLPLQRYFTRSIARSGIRD